MQNWRLIPVINADGPTQMAIDRHLLQSHLAGEIPAVLRFYTWDRPTISLGFHQKNYPDHWSDVVWDGNPLAFVRRPTGGRAVLHQGDLTYAVIASHLSKDRRESYAQICQFLIQGFAQLGIGLSYGDGGRGYIHQPDCFGTATAADLVMADGSKLIGSAQLRRDGGILQHGSIRLDPNPELYGAVFGSKLLRLPQLPMALRSLDPIIQALTASAKICFSGDWHSEALTDLEVALEP
jgi:lipoate---protein ligase